MITLRTLTLPLLLAATLGLSACGGDDDAAAEPTSPVVQAVEGNATEFENTVAARRAELEQITADMKSGKLSRRKGAKRIDQITKELLKGTSELAADAESAATTPGTGVTKLELDTSEDEPSEAEEEPSKAKDAK